MKINSLIVHGPYGCGKTTHSHLIARAFGLTNIADDWSPLRPIPPNSLVLTSSPLPNPHVLSYDVAMEVVAAIEMADAKSIFDHVSDMNVAFGNAKGDPTAINWDRLNSQCKNLKKELQELMDALAERNTDKVRDALCDLQVFTQGAQHIMGVDGDDDMLAVLDGVMSRFCKDEAELAATETKYRNLGVEFYVEGVFPNVCLKSAFDRGGDAESGFEYPKGKFLKSANYREPTFTPLG